MANITLKVITRDPAKKAKAYRDEGMVPAEYYGKGVTNMQLAVAYGDFRRAFKAAGKSTVVDLEIDGTKHHALIHAVDFDPVQDTFIHIDFLHVDLNKEVDAKIPFEFIGVSPAVRDLYGTLTVSMNGLDVRCLAKDLVHSFIVDVSSIVDFTSAIRVADIKLPEGYKLMAHPEDVVITAIAPRAEKEEEAPAVAAADVPTSEQAAPDAAKKAEEAGDKGGDKKKEKKA